VRSLGDCVTVTYGIGKVTVISLNAKLKQINNLTSVKCSLNKLQIRSQGLTSIMFFYAIIVSKIVYGISSWYSFLVKAQIAQSLFKRAFKYGYVRSVSRRTAGKL